jgi:hypothetical protein
MEAHVKILSMVSIAVASLDLMVQYAKTISMSVIPVLVRMVAFVLI